MRALQQCLMLHGAELTSMHVAHNFHPACMHGYQAFILHACSLANERNAVLADVSHHIQLPDAETRIEQILAKPS